MTPIRVIVTDDHPVVRSGIRDLLNQAPDITVVAEAAGGEEAYALSLEHRPDVLLLDMEMPEVNGIDVARRLVAEGLPIKVLALSAHDSVHFIHSILESGAYGYLTKEEMPETILEAVRGVSRGEKGWLSKRARERMDKYLTVDGDPLSKLSEREQQVLELIGQGCDNLTIAEVLNISDRTVRNHASNIYAKLGFGTRAELVAWAWEYGLLK